MWSLCRRGLFFFGWGLAGVLGWLANTGIEARAADWALSPGIAVTGEYNDNVLFTRDKISDFIFQVKPKVLFSMKTEQTELGFDSYLFGEKYIENPDFDTLSNESNLLVSHRWTERSSSALKLNFLKDKILETELARAGIPAVRTDRYRYGFDLSNTYALTEVHSLTAGAGIDRSEYPEDVFPNLQLWQINLSPAWMVNPRDTVGIRFDYSSADYEDTAVIQTLSETIYWRRQLTETTFFTLAAGYRSTWSKTDAFRTVFDPVNGVFILTPFERRGYDDGFLLNVSLNNRWSDRFFTILSAGREQYNTVDVRNTERTYIRSTLGYRLSDTVTANCDLGYDFNDESGTGNLEENYARISPYIDWKITGDLNLRLSVSYERLETDTDAGDFTRERYRTWISLTYDWPRLWANP